jgi:hypothetical protein
MGTWESPQAAHEEAALAHMEYLIKHHQWLQEQDTILGDLIEEGVENQIAIAGALAVIGKAQTFAKVAGPIVQGVGKIWKNIVWGSGVAVRTVDVKKIDAAFNDSKTFVAEIKKRFPKSHEVISKLRQDLKVYQYDLSNIVDDLKLMADSTIRDVDKSTRTLKLRKKILDGDRMSPEKDQKIWNQTIKGQTQNLTDSIEKCDKIISALEKLQKAVAVCRDELQNEIDSLRKRLEASNKELKRKLVDLEKKMKSIGCVNNGKELLRAIFTLGLACLFDNDTKKKMLNVKADLREEQAIIQAISKRMNYFDDLLGSADTLVKQAAEVLKTTKTFRQALVQAKTVLERDYTPEDVAENLGDVDFANDFAEELYKVLHNLKVAAEHVASDCLNRKHKLDAALSGINKYFGEELDEIVELAAMTDAEFGVEFNKINDRCSGYFENVSSMVDRVQNGFIVKVINGLLSMKNVLLLEDKNSFTNLKLQLFDVLDNARDVQLAIESA